MSERFNERYQLPMAWPDPPFQIALVEPEIPPNTGNISRLCAATGTPLHLVGKLGFEITDAQLRRAGLDYWEHVRLTRHATLEDFYRALAGSRFFYFSTRAKKSFLDADFAPGDVLVFGNETRGLSSEILEANPDRVLGIPVRLDYVRSLNLSTAVGIVLYEALKRAALKD